ncbi:MAG: transglutaminase domain-containing protein, partial [Bacteroidales bacterium]|nr:transglutaminase domain-containing protein [Bacteroidales bacterium]
AASSDKKIKAEASLVLSMLSNVDKTNKESFKEFMNFFNASDNPYPYMYALWSTACIFEGAKKTSEQLELLNKVIEDTKAEGTIQAMAVSSLGDHYEITNNLNNAEKEYEKLGANSVWQIVGEFENISGSGFDKNYEPIKYVDSKHPFVNKYGATVYWFDMPANKRNKWMYLTYHFYYHNAIIYAQTFVYSPSDKDVQLRIGTSGSLKAWVNDNLVYSESEERNNDLDTYIATIKLKKGYNRILIQIGESEIGASNFLMRITDNKGRPVPNMLYSKTPKEYTPDNSYKSTYIPNFAEEFFKKEIEQNPNKMLNYLLLANTYLRNQKSYEARKILLKAQKIAPKCSFIHYDLLDVYYSEKNNTDYNATLEWLKDNDPKSLFSLNCLYREDIDKEDYKGAEEKLDQIENLYGINQATMSKRIELAAKNKKQEELIKLAEAAYKKYPEEADFVDLKHAIEVEVNKNYPGAIRVLKKYLSNHYTTSILASITDDYFHIGDITNGFSSFKELIELNPGEAEYPKQIGDVYFQLQKYSEAEDWYKKSLVLAPYVGAYWGELASAYENQSQKTNAIDAYKKSITYSPNQYENRKKLTKLEDKKDPYDYFTQPDVYAICKSSPKASEYPEDNSVILLDETQKIVYSGGASEEKHIILIKVLNAQGIDTWKNYTIYYYYMQRLLIEKAEVIKPSGSKIAAETSDNKIVFTSLEVGDAIHITYKVENYYVGKLAPYFSNKCYFSHAFPYLKTKYSLLISPEIKFTSKFSQEEIAPKVTKDKEFDLYIWEKTNQESIKSEDKMPKFSDYANVLHLSSFPDWTYISNWYYDLASTKAKSDFEVKETVASLFEGKTNLSTMAKVKEIYNYIVKNIRYSSVSFLQSSFVPQKASKVLNTKLGDCKDVSTLFVAMCKEIGVNAEWVLVNTKNNGKKDLLLPSVAFNHCIAKVNIDSKDYYIELTSDFLPFNSFYESLIEAYVLEIKNEKDKIVVNPFYLNPPTRNLNLISRTGTVNIDGENLNIIKTNYKVGLFAADMRSSYRDLGKKEQEKSMLEALTGEYPNVKLNSLEFKHLDDRTDTVIYKYNYTASGAITKVSGLSLFIIPWAMKADAKDFIFAQERKYPIDISSTYISDSNVETLVIILPPAKILAEIPKTIKYTCAIADYTLTFSVLKNKITAKRELKIKKDIIQLSEIKQFADFYKKVITADTKQIAFK